MLSFQSQVKSAKQRFETLQISKITRTRKTGKGMEQMFILNPRIHTGSDLGPAERGGNRNQHKSAQLHICHHHHHCINTHLSKWLDNIQKNSCMWRLRLHSPVCVQSWWATGLSRWPSSPHLAANWLQPGGLYWARQGRWTTSAWTRSTSSGSSGTAWRQQKRQKCVLSRKELKSSSLCLTMSSVRDGASSQRCSHRTLERPQTLPLVLFPSLRTLAEPSQSIFAADFPVNRVSFRCSVI